MTDTMQLADRILAIKRNTGDADRLVLPIVNSDGMRIGDLRCVDSGLATSEELIDDLTEWRNRYMSFFLTQFTATSQRTKDWLERLVLPSPDRILFAIVDAEEITIGNFGVCNITPCEAELDNLIRGRRSNSKRIIYFAEVALLRWIFDTLAIPAVCLHVFSTNEPTIRLHTEVGFAETEATPMEKVLDGEEIRYVVGSKSDTSAELQYLTMSLSGNDFRRRFSEI